MSKIKISGFYDEVSSNLKTQLDLMKELGESYICPRNINGKSILLVFLTIKFLKPPYVLKNNPDSMKYNGIRMESNPGNERFMPQCTHITIMIHIPFAKSINSIRSFIRKNSFSKN